MSELFTIRFINATETELKKIGFDKSYINKAIDKHKFKTIKIYGLKCAQANILKQTAIAAGTDCAVHREVITGKVELSDCILSGSLNQFQKICDKLKFQPLKLNILGEQIKKLLNYTPENLIIRNIKIDWSKPYIMGILNVTPDSFSDGGEYYSLEKALNHYREMIEQGADFIDIGGESTRPYSQKITVEEEIKRVVPVIEEIRQSDKNTIISIDTRNAKTAKISLNAGADIINDVSAFEWDKEMQDIVKEYGCPVVLNHSKGTPDVMQNDTTYTDVVDTIYDYFQKKIESLVACGIKRNQIIIDPGIGFGKSTDQNFEIINKLKEFKTLECPVLVGHSRKNFLKETIQSDNKDNLDEATLAVSQRLIENGVNILRVHNVKSHTLLKKIMNSFF